MYPLSNLQQIKCQEKLSNLINQLKQFQEFYGADKLLQQAQLLVDEQEVQVEEVNTCISEIKKFIELFSPIKEKLEQINYLMQCVDFYFKDEAQSINSELARQKNQLEQFKNHGLGDGSNYENIFTELDLIFVDQIEGLFNKIKEIYSERQLNSGYQAYFDSQIGLMQPLESDPKTKADFLLQQLYWLIDFLNKFEGSYQYFNELKAKFEKGQEEYSNLCVELINSESINDIKKTINQQIEILNEDFSEFDPQLNFHEELDIGLSQLDKKLNELSMFNHAELHKLLEQQNKLIEDLTKTKENLTKHIDKKLSQASSRLAKAKREKIEAINLKIDSLLNPEINQEDNVLNEKITDNILDLQKMVGEAKTILSEYRGISLLRCFATLWGGGKVTSQLLVENLEEQLVGLQDNINRLPLKL